MSGRSAPPRLTRCCGPPWFRYCSPSCACAREENHGEGRSVEETTGAVHGRIIRHDLRKVGLGCSTSDVEGLPISSLSRGDATATFPSIIGSAHVTEVVSLQFSRSPGVGRSKHSVRSPLYEGEGLDLCISPGPESASGPRHLYRGTLRNNPRKVVRGKGLADWAPRKR